MNLNQGRKNTLSSLEGYFLLPSWWILSFEQAIKSNSLASDQSQKTGIFPALHQEELNALLNILSLVQENIFCSKNSSYVKIDLDKYRKSFTLQQNHKFSYDRVAQLFCTLMYLSIKEDSEQDPTHQTYKAQRFVSNFSIETTILNNKNGSNSKYNESVFNHYQASTINIELTPIGISSVLGYFNPYSYLIDPSIKIPAGFQPPIVISSSTWADLTVQEQLIFLNMKKAMYWNGSWLHFDGIFGTELSEIQSTLSWLGSSKIRSKYFETKEFLNRISKKLLEHGFITHCSPSSYLALEPTETQALFIWQASLKELAILSDKALLSLCLLKTSQFIKDEFSKLTKILSSDKISSNENLLLKDFYNHIEQNHSMYFYPALDKNTNAPISMFFLFIEWCLRNSKTHPFSILDFIQDSSISQICTIKKEDDLNSMEAKLEAFSTLLYRNHKLSSFLQKTSFSSLSSKNSRNDPKLLDYLKKYNSNIHSELNIVSTSLTLNTDELKSATKKVLSKDQKLTGIDNNKKELSTGSGNGYGASSSSSANSLLDSNLTQDQITTKELQMASLNKIKITPKIKNIIPSLEKSGFNPSFQNLKKIALEELNNLKAKYPEKYAKLKQQYMDSLSEEKRQILLDVHDRVDEKVFDSHLKHGLLKYMVDNPNSWSSARTS